MAKTVLKIENVSKLYRLGEIGTGTLSHDLNRWWHRIRGKEDPYQQVGTINQRDQKGNTDYVWALKDINLEVKEGEILGIIGANGAGKSTLLKILSKVTAPTTGRIRGKGRVASLLEVGTGFHQELTGRENIYLNGAVLGMSRTEVTIKLDEIVDFAGVARYLDTPIKRYSSGMKVRLGFAIAAHLQTDILIVDEVLAVGDAYFQKKSLKKMDEVSKAGRTVLYVSHRLSSVQTLCNSSILLQNGKIIEKGITKHIISKYLKATKYLNEFKGMIIWSPENSPGNSELKLSSVKLKDVDGGIRNIFGEDDKILVEIEGILESEIRGMRLYLQIKSAPDQVVFTTTSQEVEPYYKKPGSIKYSICIPPILNTGTYIIYFHMGIPGQRKLIEGQDFLEFRIEKTTNKSGTYSNEKWPGVILPQIEWKIN